MPSDALIAALSAATGFDPINVTGTSTSVRLVGRIPVASMPVALQAFSSLLAGVDSTWAVDVSKLYFLSADKKVVFAWRFIFEAKQGELPIDKITRLLSTAAPSVPAASGSIALAPVRRRSCPAVQGGGE